MTAKAAQPNPFGHGTGDPVARPLQRRRLAAFEIAYSRASCMIETNG
jgi:hypothetical protein